MTSSPKKSQNAQIFLIVPRKLSACLKGLNSSGALSVMAGEVRVDISASAVLKGALNPDVSHDVASICPHMPNARFFLCSALSHRQWEITSL